MGKAVCRREVTGWGQAGVFEEGNGVYRPSKMILKVETEAMDGGGVRHFEGCVSGVGGHVLEDGQG